MYHNVLPPDTYEIYCADIICFLKGAYKVAPHRSFRQFGWKPQLSGDVAPCWFGVENMKCQLD